MLTDRATCKLEECCKETNSLLCSFSYDLSVILNSVFGKVCSSMIQNLAIKPGFHIVVTGRWVSLTVFRSHWSIWVIGNHCQSLRSFRVVDSLSWSLTVFQSFYLNCYLWRQTYYQSSAVFQGRFRVVRQMYSVLFCFVSI